jgi:hypothetical protein
MTFRMLAAVIFSTPSPLHDAIALIRIFHSQYPESEYGDFWHPAHPARELG